MSIHARELEAFFNEYGKLNLAKQAGKLAVEAQKLEDDKVLEVIS